MKPAIEEAIDAFENLLQRQRRSADGSAMEGLIQERKVIEQTRMQKLAGALALRAAALPDGSGQREFDAVGRTGLRHG